MNLFRKTVRWRCSGNNDPTCNNYVNKTELDRGAWYCPDCPSDVIEDKAWNIPVVAAAGGICLLMMIVLSVWAYHAVIRAGEGMAANAGKEVQGTLKSAGTEAAKAISQEIYAAFYRDPLLKKAPIKAQIRDHRVSLSGTVPSRKAKEEAENVVRGLPGVSSVNDSLTITPAPKPSSVPEAAADSSDHKPHVSAGSKRRLVKKVPLEGFTSRGHHGLVRSNPTVANTAGRVTRSDGQIQDALIESLAQDPKLQTTNNMRVTFSHGTATLGGPVQSQAVINEAVRRAYSVPGVLRVNNGLYVKVPQQRVTYSAPRFPLQLQAVTVVVPAGTQITVRTNQDIDSSRDHVGQKFSATVESQVVEGNHIAIPRFCDARLRLVNVQNAGRLRGRSKVQLQLVSITVRGKPYAVDTSTITKQAASSRGKQTAKKAALGAVMGGIIGAITGGGKGAAIGAGAGAAGGTGVQAVTKPQPARIPAEGILDFTVQSPISITVNP